MQGDDGKAPAQHGADDSWDDADNLRGIAHYLASDLTLAGGCIKHYVRHRRADNGQIHTQD